MIYVREYKTSKLSPIGNCFQKNQRSACNACQTNHTHIIPFLLQESNLRRDRSACRFRVWIELKKYERVFVRKKGYCYPACVERFGLFLQILDNFYNQYYEHASLLLELFVFVDFKFICVLFDMIWHWVHIAISLLNFKCILLPLHKSFLDRTMCELVL